MTDGIRHAAGPPHGGQRLAWRAAARFSAGALVATVVPLSLAQIPCGGFPFLAGSGSATQESGLVLPFAVAAAPLAALAVRRTGAWPVMFCGLVLIIAGAAVAATLPATALLAGSVSALRGSGAGMALPATAALAAGRGAGDGSARRPLAAWWAAVAVASLAVLPGLTRTEPAADGWRTAFGPAPLLAAGALAAALLYRLTADRQPAGQAGNSVTGRAGSPGIGRIVGRGWDRAAFPAVQRAQIALLTPPAAALAVLAAAVGGRSGHALAAVAVCEAAVLLALAAMTSRAAAGDGFAVACAMAGFVVAPASAELLNLRAAIAGTGGGDGLLAAAAIAGAALGAITVAAGSGARRVTAGSVGGLLLASGALVVACFAGPFADTAALGLLVAAVAGGLTAALARPAGETTTAGAMVGAVLLVSGMLVGGLAAAAIRVQLAAPGSAAGALPSGLLTAYGWWLLAGAAVAVAVALTRSARRDGAVSLAGDTRPDGVRRLDTHHRDTHHRDTHDTHDTRDTRHAGPRRRHDAAAAATTTTPKAPRHGAARQPARREGPPRQWVSSS